VSAPVVIDYDPLSIVRAKSDGFAHEIHVVDGQEVQEGDLLVTLENVELQHELRSLLIDISISELRSNNLFNVGEISQVQLERESLESMLKQKKDLEDRLADLQIHAPQSGVVLARDLDSNVGKHFIPGDEILSIARPGEIQAIALTRQTDIEWVGERPDAEIQLLVWGRHENDLLKGRIKHVAPRARDDMPHEAFAATAGGPLAVVPRGQVQDEGGEDGDMMLTEPRVPIEIELDPNDRDKLIPGQTGKLIVRSRDQNMGSYLAQNLIQFVRQNNLRTHGL
jgi:putative peptide zinc metalloprotease protein